MRAGQTATIKMQLVMRKAIFQVFKVRISQLKLFALEMLIQMKIKGMELTLIKWWDHMIMHLMTNPKI